MKDGILAIRADLPNLDAVLKQIERMEGGDLPYTREAVKTATELVQRTWLDYISGTTVTYSGGTFTIRSVSGEYRRSIVDGLSYPALGDPLTGEVTATAPHAHNVEDGIRPFDMKQTHLRGSKVKIGKDGKRYITVPFRHNTPGHGVTGSAMPQKVYDRAMQLAISRRNGVLVDWYSARKYEWGDRLSAEHGGKKEKPHWTTGRYTGMVKMSGAPHTSYMTFRRLSENSKPEAWMHPGTEARPVTKAVEENTRDEIIQLIRTGFEVDIATLGLFSKRGGGR